MTLIEILWLVLWVGFGMVGALLGRFITGSTPGAFAGLALGLLSLPVAAVLGDFLVRRFSRGPHRWPPCLCGSREHRAEWTFQGGTVHHCSCGEAYVRNGAHVFRKTPTGARQPYLRWHWRRGWSSRGLPPPRLDSPYRG